MSYQLREHTADVAVSATAETLGGVFAATADGMTAAMCADPPTSDDEYDVTVTAERREALLFDYLDELIYERDTRAVLPVDNRGTVKHEPSGSGLRFEGTYRGVPLARVDARNLKAVTYAQMSIEETPTGWRAYVVFDV